MLAWIKPWGLVLSILIASPVASVAADVYVSPKGDDANEGTSQAPVASLKKALDIVADAGPGTIWLQPGEYFLAAGVVIDSRHNGTEQTPMTIQAVESGTVRLSGARTVTDFRPLKPDEAQSLISDQAKKHVVVADLAGQDFPPLAPLPVQHRAHGGEEVVFGDQVMQSARWPNEGFTVFDEVIDAGASKPVHWVTREVYRPGSFRFPNDRAKRWDFSRGVWLHGFWCYDWCDEALKAASYDAETGELRFAAKHAYGIGSPWSKNAQRRFYALHVFEELDQPGEYYLDRQQNRLFFWPPGDVSQTPVRLTLCKQPLIQATGAAHLVIRGVTIENGRNQGISMTGCRNCRVEDCLVRNMGKNGIYLTGSQMSADRCEVTGTASYGIGIDGGDRKTLTPGRNAVTNCHIHHIGRLDWMGGRGVTMRGCGNRIANNLIHHGPTGAISYGGNEHVLELNEVHHMCTYYSDVGVFYTGRDWASRGNLVRWNYIHDNTNNAGHGSSAIYLDDCDSGDTVVGNIVLGGVGRGVLLGGGRDNIIHGNLFVDLPIGIHVDARGPRGITLDKPGSWNLLDKCKAVDYLSPLWRERYPKLATVLDDDPLMPRGNSLQNNILLGCEKPFSIAKEIDRDWLGLEGNREGSLEGYPALSDIRNGQPALEDLPHVWEDMAEFDPIPVHRIGPR